MKSKKITTKVQKNNNFLKKAAFESFCSISKKRSKNDKYKKK